MQEHTLDVENLSSRRLWEIVRLSELENVSVDEALMTRIKQQLLQRNEYHQHARWR